MENPISHAWHTNVILLLISKFLNFVTFFEGRKILFLGSKVRLVHRADNLAAICEAIVYTMWDP
jgi:hypothetical protein